MIGRGDERCIAQTDASHVKQNARFSNQFDVVLGPGKPVRWMNYSNEGAKPGWRTKLAVSQVIPKTSNRVVNTRQPSIQPVTSA